MAVIASTRDVVVAVVVLAAVIVIAVGVSYWLSRRQLEQIHVLVNRRLEVALQEITDLKAEREAERAARPGGAVPSDADRVDDG